MFGGSLAIAWFKIISDSPYFTPCGLWLASPGLFQGTSGHAQALSQATAWNVCCCPIDQASHVIKPRVSIATS